MATDATRLVDDYKVITAPGSTANAWKWARRVTAALEPMGQFTIGNRRDPSGRSVIAIQLFRCPDESRFAYSMNGANEVWSMPDDREG